MLGSWGYRFLVVLLLVASFLAVSSGISYTGGIVGESEKQAFEPKLVYTIPENQCPDSSEMEEAMEGCKDVLKKYEEKVGELETEKEILNQRIMILLNEQCEIGGGVESIEDAEEIVDTERVRGFAVFIVSDSLKDSITSLYDYVRMNIKFVKDPGKEYVACPCETILSEGGDCDDHAILLASLLEAVGVDSRIVWVPGEHTFVGIAVKDMDIDGLCEDPFWFEENGEKILIADTTFSNCMGRVNEEYVVFEENGWEWKNEPVIFDV